MRKGWWWRWRICQRAAYRTYSASPHPEMFAGSALSIRHSGWPAVRTPCGIRCFQFRIPIFLHGSIRLWKSLPRKSCISLSVIPIGSTAEPRYMCIYGCNISVSESLSIISVFVQLTQLVGKGFPNVIIPKIYHSNLACIVITLGKNWGFSIIKTNNLPAYFLKDNGFTKY